MIDTLLDILVLPSLLICLIIVVWLNWEDFIGELPRKKKKENKVTLTGWLVLISIPFLFWALSFIV